METILVSSGYPEATLEVLRQRWHVVDICDAQEALAYLQQCDRLPEAVAIGYVPDGPTPPGYYGAGMPATQMLPRIHELDPDLPVVISTGQGKPAAIVDLIKRGAFDYVVEPNFSTTEPEVIQRYTQDLAHALSRAVQWRLTITENRRLKKQRFDENADMPLHARSPSMLRVLDLVQKVAPTPATVLVTGDSGTGKELIARAIHRLSPNAAQPFVAVNCGALSESLLTSELFGHVKGAFTGADVERPGLIREAGTGTLMLDEVATIPAAFQVMLLRVLEQRTARPVGGQHEYPVRCRFVAAANCDLKELVRKGQFREDLYYRLNVFHVHVPPLRQRQQDTPVLAHHFLRQAAEMCGKEVISFEPAAMDLLERYPWPGNVRQLRNAVERAVILCEGRQIRPGDLAQPLRSEGIIDPQVAELDYHRAMQTFETRLLRKAMAQARGNLSAAARMLSMKRTTLHYRLRQLGLSREAGGAS